MMIKRKTSLNFQNDIHGCSEIIVEEMYKVITQMDKKIYCIVYMKNFDIHTFCSSDRRCNGICMNTDNNKHIVKLPEWYSSLFCNVKKKYKIVMWNSN